MSKFCGDGKARVDQVCMIATTSLREFLNSLSPEESKVVALKWLVRPAFANCGKARDPHLPSRCKIDVSPSPKCRMERLRDETRATAETPIVSTSC